MTDFHENSVGNKTRIKIVGFRALWSEAFYGTFFFNSIFDFLEKDNYYCSDKFFAKQNWKKRYLLKNHGNKSLNMWYYIL